MASFIDLVREHRFISVNDAYDLHFDDGAQPWSRVYEYPWILKKMAEIFAEDPGSGILDFHNSCWGWQGCHVTFREALDKSWKGIHSDIIYHPSQSITKIKSYHEHPTLIQNVAHPNPRWMKRAFSTVLNISVLEELPPKIMAKGLRNLLQQIAPNGHLLITYDYPMESVKILHNLFGEPEPLPLEERLNGVNSVVPNSLGNFLNVGVLWFHKRIKT